ncbi:alpha/beta hydrolase fold domain-containing protein [Paenibacillus zanthoxyli]|nr:alpha/beta hydrolase fold domain-containing protein [Paenibacillus zanthoxyli]
MGRPEVDPNRIALMGISFGGNLASRAASRAAAAGGLSRQSSAVLLDCGD